MHKYTVKCDSFAQVHLTPRDEESVRESNRRRSGKVVSIKSFACGMYDENRVDY